MSKTAEVVVIGGGINGASIAYNLAHDGVKNVVLVEKGHIASGPTGRSSGIVRQHYTLPTLAKMAHDSIHVFESFAQRIGGDAGFVQCGVVFFCGPHNEAAMRKTIAMHHGLGIQEEILTGAELRKLEPFLASDDIAIGGYEPDGGYADPALAANNFAEAAAQLGVEILRHTLVTSLRIEAGKIAGVVTDKGEISSRTVINVAGPWGKAIAAMAGVHIPIQPSRHPVVILQRPAAWRSSTPVWGDLVRGWYFKPERGAGLMVGSLSEAAHHTMADIETYSTVPSYEEVETYSDATLKRFPVMLEGMAQGGWAGLYDVTPDSQPVIDRIGEVPGFYCAVGFSGHGFKLGPAVGVLMSELVRTGQCTTYDISSFRHTRFREGCSSKGAYEYSIVG